MPAFIDWGSLLKWQPSPAPAPSSLPLHEPPSPAADDRLPSFLTPDSYILIATVAIAVLSAVVTWLLVEKLHLQRPAVGPPPADAQVAARLQNHDDAIEALRGGLRQAALAREERTKEVLDQQAEDAGKVVSTQIDALEGQFQEALEQRIQVLEAQTQAALEAHAAALEAALRRRLGQRVEEVEDALRAKLNKEAFDALYAALGRRVEALEAGVRLLDGRQLDQEAGDVAQRALGRRLDAVEAAARASTTPQRLDALEDGLRVADCRGRTAGQRLDALEDNVGAFDGQATLLAHDVERGRASLDRLARQVRALPGPDRLRELVDDWEARFGALEAHVADELARRQRQQQLEEEAAPPTLSWSPLVAQEIEPAGPLYTAAAATAATTTPHDHQRGHHGFAYPAEITMPPTPSPSDRSHSSHSSRLSSFIPTPAGSRRKKLEEAGFKEPTFASRQRLFHARTGSSAA